MSLLTFFGCLFLAYGPILAIFFIYIARNAQYVLLMVASAFFCLIALLLSSVIWYAAKGAQDIYAASIAYSVLIQEICRWGFYTLINKAESGLNIVSANPSSPFNRPIFAFVSGYGYALMSALVGYISLLVESIGPGVLMCPSCPQVTLFFISAITTSLFSLMHMSWMMIAFDGFSEANKVISWLKISWVILSHYGASYATLMNSSTNINNGCVYSVIVCIIIVTISSSIVFLSLRSKYQLTRK